MHHTLKPTAAAFLTALVLVGCGGLQIRENETEIDRDRGTAAELLNSARSGQAVGPSTLSVIEDADFVPAKPREVDQSTIRLPIRCKPTFGPVGRLTLVQFGQQVTKDCNVRVRISPDAIAHLRGATTATPALNSGPSPAPVTPVLPAGVSLPPAIGGSGPLGSFGGSSGDLIDIQLDNVELEYLLDAVTARLGLSWKYAGGTVTISYLETRVFRLYNLPDRTQMESTVSSGIQSSMGASSTGSGGMSQGGSTSGVSGQAGSSQTTSVKIETDAAADLRAMVTSMLTPNVGRMSLTSASGGMLVVTDTPEVLDEIAAVVENVNELAAKQVVFRVKVLRVRKNRTSDFGINWDLVYKSISGGYGVNLANAFASADDAVSGTINILEGSSRFSGSELVAKALATQGEVSVITEVPVTALNYEAVPVQVADTRSYLARVQQSATPDVGLSTALEPGSVTVGFNMHLLPQVQPDGRNIVLRYSINQAELKGIREVTSGESSIEMPDVSMTIFSQKVRIRSGQTLVVSGFDSESKSADRSGVGSPKFWLLGGGAKSERNRDSIVILISPVVMSDDA